MYSFYPGVAPYAEHPPIDRFSAPDRRLLERVEHVGKKIGRTPLHPVLGLNANKNVRVYAKKEWEQLSGSVKARAAFQIIRTAVRSGAYHAGNTLLDATSGNTGIAYAAIARELGLKVALCLPENASVERKEILAALGAEIIYTSRFGGTDEAQETAQYLAAQYPERYFYADQYKNDANWRAHYEHTAVEIFEALPAITHFVAGMGTTGSFTGAGRRLRQFNPNIGLIGLQPDTPLHGMDGWKHLETATVPGIFDPNLADEYLEINTVAAYDMIRRAYETQGLKLSPSSAANLVGAIKVADRLERGVVVTLLPDNADKYGEVMRKVF